MPADGVGSSVIIALAAFLWLAYLVPSWLRRREYLSTERNALRLQQTLRVMAESAEMPAEVRLEATARGAAQQEKLLRQQQNRTAAITKAQEAALARTAARRLAEVQPAIAADIAVTSTASRRLRRSRAITSLVLLMAIVAAGFGVSQLLATGAWLLLAGGVVVAVGSFAMLGQMAAVSHARVELAQSLRARPVARRVVEPVAAPVIREQVSWTPVPLPKPLYLSRPQVARALDVSLQAAAELRQAAADAERKLREAHEAHEAPEVRPLRPVAVVSRFAAMGIVDAAATGTPDLDAALARRRA
jgi:hypothetical protein